MITILLLPCRPLAQQGAFQAELARARIDIQSARLLVLAAAESLDRYASCWGEGSVTPTGARSAAKALACSAVHYRARVASGHACFRNADWPPPGGASSTAHAPAGGLLLATASMPPS